MKRTIKKLTALILILVLGLSMVACGSKEDNGDDSKGDSGKEISLSEYILKNEPCIVYVNSGQNMSKDEMDTSTPELPRKPAKDESPFGLYYFNNGKVSVYKTELTYGEITKLSDEEVIEQCTPYSDNSVNTDYRFVVYTDDTGNNTKYETIVVRNGDCILTGGNNNFSYFLTENTMPVAGEQTIYDTDFYGWSGMTAKKDISDSIGRPSIWLKKSSEDGIIIKLDTPDSENVVMDPECENLDYDYYATWVPKMDIFNEN